MVTLRVRSIVWFATGVVLTLLATVIVMQTWRVDAAPGDTDSTFVPVANCRLFDFRSGPDNVGPRDTPLGAGESNVYTQSVRGTNGDCTIPPDAVGVAMNVTVVNPTAQSNLRVFPADIDTPNASNLNWLPGQSPTPNKVDVQLSANGEIKLYNHAGNVDVLADVVGYYTDSSLRDLDQRLASIEAGQPFAVAERSDLVTVDFVAAAVVSMDVTAPTDGHFTVNSAGWATANSGDEIQCSIAATNTTPPEHDVDYLQVWEAPEGGQLRSQISGTRSFSVTSGQTLPLKLVCSRIGGSSITISDVVLTAIFTPAP